MIDPRPLLDEAAAIAARYGGGLLIAETLAAGLNHDSQLWFGNPANVGPLMSGAAQDMGIAVHVTGA